MLKGAFQWLDVHPASYWLPAGVATLLLTIQVWSAVRQKEPHPPAPGIRGACDALVIFLFLFAWRWPFLLAANEFNPDESQLIAGSITLAHDPVFWRSVDGTTSGPLNFYLLVPFSWLGLSLDYFTARLIGLLLIGTALFASHRALAKPFGRAVAWFGIVPATAFFATVTHPDLIHYSSEHLTLCLIAISIWLLATPHPASQRRLWLASFIAGAAIWAKLQAAPLSAALVGWGLWLVIRESSVPATLRRRRVALVGLAALAPTLLAIALVAATGQTEAMVRRYFLQNLFYVGHARPFAEAIRGMNLMAATDGRLNLLLATSGIILLGSTAYFLVRRKRPPALFAFGGLLTLAAIVSVLVPRREYLHYALLLPVPLTLWVGAAVGGWWAMLSSRSLRWIPAGLLFLAAGLTPAITRSFQPPPEIYGRFAYHWSHPRTSAATIVRALAGRNGSLAIWGWAADVYVESGLPQATRDTHSAWSIVANEQRDYHRAGYLEDLRHHEPPVFVDAVGPGAFCYEDRATQSHENFTELAAYIRQNYTLVTDLSSARIYARNGLATLQEMTPTHILTLNTQGRLKEQQRINTTPAPLTRIDHLQRKIIAQQDVLMIPPPTQLEWTLDENVREVLLEFGFDPVACEQGKSNGAGIFLELANDYGSQTLFHRFLDPAQHPEDRQPQTALVTLPAFTPGTRLILRTDAGPNDDNTWDWIYLANLQFKLGPPARK